MTDLSTTNPTSTIELRPDERVQLVFRDSVIEIVGPGTLAPRPASLRVTITTSFKVHVAPDLAARSYTIQPRTIDVFEQVGDWWRVTDPPQPPLWMKAVVAVPPG